MQIKIRKRYPLLVLILLAASAAFWLNPILEKVLEGYIRREIVLHSAEAGFSLDYEALELDIFSEKLNLRQVRARAADDSLHPGGEGLGTLRIGRITLEGINLTNFLWNETLSVRSISLDTLQLNLRRALADSALGGEDSKLSGTRIDSIRLPGIDHVRLSRFELDHFRLNLSGPDQKDTVASFFGDRLLVEGVGLSADARGTGAYLVPELAGLELELSRQRYTLTGASYELYFDRFRYRHSDKSVRVDSLAFRPLMDTGSFAEAHAHSFETYTARFSRLDIAGFDLDRLLAQGDLRMRSVAVDRLQGSIFRDKTKPYETERRVPLPDDALMELEWPLRIDTVSLRHASLEYREKVQESGPEVLVGFPELRGRIVHIVSGAAARDTGDTLKIDLQGTLLGTLPVEVSLQLPYATDHFHMKGLTRGSSRLHKLNPTIYPAMEMRFTGGRLNGMYFHADGTSRRMTGELTMLYDDLEVAFIKDDGNRKTTLSWLANTLVRNSNPNRRGKTIVGAIEFTRVPYKGVWNYVWKGVQSGVENSLNPLGDRRTE